MLDGRVLGAFQVEYKPFGKLPLKKKTQRSFAGRGQMLDGRVLGASQVEYKPFGKPL